ncbi:leucyl/phenylalanyl-tRNA--protein transferase [Sphingobacterium sp. UT-1RO-CII-1]|uniref:leucyl/phenylalanyl-tRNA--protein transferase n=1 Tax=Sphingobacterium sp. UT-1RO-CII-1 TaxID=2995225 RepID=UPI00227AF2D0|nr:leucyl/phenylalanyl-tRNA--protein transferase [Sphingobacterium sp. UT-1RO-CII-1]MCY4781154.1 leucyl/phenylalanyl-tRNA--protein transferase [Sphingobacterium sp. UT-1RO-CII-1]
MLYQLDQEIIFPHPKLANEDGLLAVGGDLSTERLLLAYSHGIFPWYADDTPILWYAPKERFVLYPNEVKINKSMRQFMRNTKFQVHQDRSFRKVIEKCASVGRKDQDGTWITEEMQKAYIDLHVKGYAHSIETYDENDVLVGGLYGILVGNIFCGESMFSDKPNASKLALVHLCQNFNIALIDCQIYSEHLQKLGAKLINGEHYYQMLQQQTLNSNGF